MEGVINLRDSRLDAHRIHVSMKDALQLDGKLDGVFGDKRKVKLRIIDCSITPQKLRPFIPSRMTERLAPLRLSGPINLDGTIDGLEKQQKWSWDCDLQARLKTESSFIHDRNGQFYGQCHGQY